MTSVTAARPQATAKRAAAANLAAASSKLAATAPPARSRRLTPLTPMRQQAARSMRKLAEGIQRDHPELAVHDHVRDAARTLESGNEEASQRHLRAAMFSLTPHSLMRNGVHDDVGHISARQAVHGVHRHLLLVKDIQDVAAKNQAAIRRDSYGDYESGPTVPRPDPNAGYGPGALAQKPTARQPAGDQALNAPARTNSGGSDPAVADPVGPQPRGSKQFARTWDELASVIELVNDAWRTELRGKGGEWTAAGLTALRSMSPTEKKAYTKTGAVPERFKSAAAEKAHDTASATASRGAKARIAAARSVKATTRPAVKPAARSAPAAAPAAPAHGKPLYADDLWKSDQGKVNLSDADAAKIGKVWFNDSYESTNKFLRTGKGKADAAGIKFFADKIRSAPPLSQPITVSRVIEGADKIFGPPGTVTGKTFKDKGFTSTSAGTSILGPPPPPKGLTSMKINVPAGSHIMKAPPSVFAGGGAGGGYDLFKEYVLPPGTSFKVASDTTDAAGNRQLVMEVTG